MIALIFIAESLVALGLHGIWLRERILRLRAVRSRPEAVNLETLATLFVHTEFTRMLSNVLMLAIGFGVILYGGQAIYLLLLAPVISIVSSVQYLRSMR